MDPTQTRAPAQTLEYTVQYSFLSSGIRRIEYDTFGLGLLLDFQSMEDPHQALRLGLALTDAAGMLHALQQMAAQLQAALQARPPSGPPQ
jgi:hypothetical protein